jgi:8-oxo-dGTP pyrophosphatase MutT (NUDIX family)
VVDDFHLSYLKSRTSHSIVKTYLPVHSANMGGGCLRMICVHEGNCRFNYRVAGVALRESDGYVLMHRTERDPLWALPGGRCEMDEASPDALVREMREELGVTVRVGRLLFIAEIFFGDEDEPRCHELGLYFAMDFPEDDWVYEQTSSFPGYEPSLPLIYQWIPLPSTDTPDEAVAGFPVLPIFLRTALHALPETPRHVIHRENADRYRAAPGDNARTAVPRLTAADGA